MKILIVDDSKVMRSIVRRSLREAGYGAADVLEAVNGADGLAKVPEYRPDLILSDWNMPEMTGIEFLTALRGGGDATPFGFVTSEGSDSMRARAAEGGAAFLLAKPFTSEDLAARLKETLAA